MPRGGRGGGSGPEAPSLGRSGNGLRPPPPPPPGLLARQEPLYESFLGTLAALHLSSPPHQGCRLSHQVGANLDGHDTPRNAGRSRGTRAHVRQALAAPDVRIARRRPRCAAATPPPPAPPCPVLLPCPAIPVPIIRRSAPRAIPAPLVCAALSHARIMNREGRLR
jgi:hypothetical protein